MRRLLRSQAGQGFTLASRAGKCRCRFRGQSCHHCNHLQTALSAPFLFCMRPPSPRRAGWGPCWPPQPPLEREGHSQVARDPLDLDHRQVSPRHQIDIKRRPCLRTSTSVELARLFGRVGLGRSTTKREWAKPPREGTECMRSSQHNCTHNPHSRQLALELTFVGSSFQVTVHLVPALAVGGVLGLTAARVKAASWRTSNRSPTGEKAEGTIARRGSSRKAV